MLEAISQKFKKLSIKKNRDITELKKKEELFSSSNDDNDETHGYSEVFVFPLRSTKGCMAEDELIVQVDPKGNTLTVSWFRDEKSSIEITLTEENSGENFKNIIDRLPAVFDTSKDTYLIGMIASTCLSLLKQPTKPQSSDNLNKNTWATVSIITENGVTPRDKDGYVMRQAFVERHSIFKDKNVFTRPEQSTQEKTEKVESHYKPVLKLDTYEASNYPTRANVTNTASVYTKKF